MKQIKLIYINLPKVTHLINSETKSQTSSSEIKSRVCLKLTIDMAKIVLRDIFFKGQFVKHSVITLKLICFKRLILKYFSEEC